MSRVRRPAFLWVLIFGALAALPFLQLRRYDLNLIDQAMIFSIAVLGLYFVLGMTGQLSLAQAGFFGVGAYISAILAVRYAMPVWINLPVAIVFATGFGVLLGIPSLKLSGHYLAMTTIGFGVILNLVYRNWKPVTGGTDGIPGIPPSSLGGASLAHPGLFYYVILACLVVATVVALRISRSRVGRAFNAIRENQLAAEATGVDSTRYKVIAFALSAAYGGLAGGLWTHFTRFIAPETFDFDTSVKMLAMLVIGGSATVAGSLIGAFLLTLLPEVLRFLQGGYIAVYGAAIILLMVFLPEGIAGGFALIVRRRLGQVEEVPRMLGQTGEKSDDAPAAG